MKASDGKTNDELSASAALARRNVELLKAQAASPLPTTGVADDRTIREARRDPAAIYDRRAREASRLAAPYVNETPLRVSLLDFIGPEKVAA